MKTCFFIGHRDAPEALFPQLAEAVEQHIAAYRVTEFVVGQYGNFDRLAARAVRAAKKRHPSVTLALLLPYHPAERPKELPDGFDASFYPPGMERVPKRFAIVRANQYMADHSQYLIAYACYPGSNARNLVERVQKKGVCSVACLEIG